MARFVHTSAIAITDQLRPIASDFGSGGGALAIDWMRMSPYPAAGSFTSRVFDAGSNVGWQQLSADQVQPAGTSTGFEVRSGNVAAPDASWSSFVPVSGGAINLTGRYLQYRASLQTSDSGLSPTLRSVTLSYGAAPVDNTAPTITARTPLNNATNVTIGSSVSATFSEPMDAATITPASVTLRAAGAGSDVPAAVSYAGGVASLVPNAPLAYNTVYTATVAASVADLAGNQLGSADSWSFTTEAAPLSTLTDTSLADFGAGSFSNTYLADGSGGEVILAPTVGAEFGGSSLPAGWSAKPAPWTAGGNYTVAGGQLSVNGTMVGTTATFTPGHSLEFVATFGAAASQHVGFVADLAFNNPWVIISTGGAGNGVFARSNTNQAGVSLGLVCSGRRTDTGLTGLPRASTSTSTESRSPRRPFPR